MKKNNLKASLPLLLFFVSLSCFAQDTINKKRQKIEIGLTSQIQFKNFEYDSEPLFQRKVYYEKLLNITSLTKLGWVDRTILNDNKTINYGFGFNFKYKPFNKFRPLYFESNFNYLKNYNSYYFINTGYNLYYDFFEKKNTIEFSDNYYLINIDYLRPDISIGLSKYIGKLLFEGSIGFGRNFFTKFSKSQILLINDNETSLYTYSRKEYLENKIKIYDAYLIQDFKKFSKETKLDFNEVLMRMNIIYGLNYNFNIKFSYSLSYQNPSRPLLTSYGYGYNQDDYMLKEYYYLYNYNKKIFSTIQMCVNYEF